VTVDDATVALRLVDRRDELGRVDERHVVRV
jgi:hypothetical protein